MPIPIIVGCAIAVFILGYYGQINSTGSGAQSHKRNGTSF